MSVTLKKRALRQEYMSKKQLTIDGFETLFSKKLDPKNSIRNISLSRKDKSNENNGDDSTIGLSEHKGLVIMDATARPKDIAYSKDLNLLSEAWKISERLIDTIYQHRLSSIKLRTYLKVLRKTYLRVAKKSSIANVT